MDNIFLFLTPDYDNISFIDYMSKKSKTIYAVYPFDEQKYENISNKFTKVYDNNNITQTCLTYENPSSKYDVFKNSQDYQRIFSLALERHAFHGIGPMFIDHKFENSVSFWLDKFTNLNTQIIIFGNVPHLVSEISALYAAKLLKIPSVFKVNIALDYPNLFFWSTDFIKLTQIKLETTLKNIKKINTRISSAMESFLYLDNKETLLYMKEMDNSRYISFLKFNLMRFPILGFLAWSYSFFKRRKIERTFYYIDSNILYDNPKSLLEYRRLFLKRTNAVKLLRAEEKKYSLKSIENIPKDFLYFPLHYQPEATTVPMAFRNYNQVNLIRKIMNVLGPNNFMVVREHPSTFHSLFSADRGRWKTYYKEISSIKNVILISHEVDNRKLMEKSKAIIALNGTSAFEASLIYGKKSFVFSEHPFLGMSGIVKINNFKKLKKSIEINLLNDQKKSPKDVIKEFVDYSTGYLTTFENKDDYDSLFKVIKKLYKQKDF